MYTIVYVESSKQEDYQIFTAGHIRYRNIYIYLWSFTFSLNILYTHRAQINPSQTKQAICGSTSHYYPFMDHHSSAMYIYIYVWMCRSINNQINIRKSQVVEIDKYVCTKTAFNPFISFKSKSSWLTGQ